MAGLPKNGNRAPIAGGGRGRHNLHRVCQTAVTDPPRVGCVVWSQIDTVSGLITRWKKSVGAVISQQRRNCPRTTLLSFRHV